MSADARLDPSPMSPWPVLLLPTPLRLAHRCVGNRRFPWFSIGHARQRLECMNCGGHVYV